MFLSRVKKNTLNLVINFILSQLSLDRESEIVAVWTGTTPVYVNHGDGPVGHQEVVPIYFEFISDHLKTRTAVNVDQNRQL